VILPRLVRLRDAPNYLGMDRNRFNRDVRPTLTEIPIGTQGIAFDRLDLDAWADEYKSRNGRSGRDKEEVSSWDNASYPGSASAAASGTSKSASRDAVGFARALERATGRKPRNC